MRKRLADVQNTQTHDRGGWRLRLLLGLLSRNVHSSASVDRLMGAVNAKSRSRDLLMSGLPANDGYVLP
jgi:hypothetical protein